MKRKREGQRKVQTDKKRKKCRHTQISTDRGTDIKKDRQPNRKSQKTGRHDNRQKDKKTKLIIKTDRQIKIHTEILRNKL